MREKVLTNHSVFSRLHPKIFVKTSMSTNVIDLTKKEAYRDIVFFIWR